MEARTFEAYPAEVRRPALMFLGDQSARAVPEASRFGSEGTESSENSENTERSEGKEGSEGTERSETTETSENSENTERSEFSEISEGKEYERALGSALNEPISKPLAWKSR